MPLVHGGSVRGRPWISSFFLFYRCSMPAERDGAQREFVLDLFNAQHNDCLLVGGM